MLPPRLLLDCLAPNFCLGCARREARHDGLGLCLVCAGRLRPAPAAPRCPTCAGPTRSPLPCPQCRRDPPAFDRLVYGWVFEEPLTRVVWGLKYRRLDYLAAPWAERLFSRVADQLPAVDTVVPVPLHWLRRLGRGYNQARLLAAPIAVRLGLPLLAMRRTRATPAQTGQGAGGRRQNLCHAFTAPRAFRALRVLLVDDVTTTGSTLRSTAAALRTAGAAQVTALVLARTAEREAGPA